MFNIFKISTQKVINVKDIDPTLNAMETNICVRSVTPGTNESWFLKKSSLSLQKIIANPHWIKASNTASRNLKAIRSFSGIKINLLKKMWKLLFFGPETEVIKKFTDDAMEERGNIIYAMNVEINNM